MQPWMAKVLQLEIQQYNRIRIRKNNTTSTSRKKNKKITEKQMIQRH